MQFTARNGSGITAQEPAVVVQDETLAAMEQRLIQEVLERTRGNKSAAATILGLSRRALYPSIERYKL